jgi:hypothetical protein
MTVQDIKSIRCEYCGNTSRFENFTSKEDKYYHLKCKICFKEITAFKEKK